MGVLQRIWKTGLTTAFKKASGQWYTTQLLMMFFRGSLLDLLYFVNIFLVLGSPELGTVSRRDPKSVDYGEIILSLNVLSMFLLPWQPLHLE